MSHCVDECYDVYQETVRRARKEHVCDACARTISPGHRYITVSVVYDGTARRYKRCGACQRTHEHLRTLCRDRDMWPDEELACGLAYEEEWECAPPDEIAALPLLSDEEVGKLL